MPPKTEDEVNRSCAIPKKTLTVAEICQLNDLSVAKAEMALANLQDKGLVFGFVPGDVNAQITMTDGASKYVN